MSEAIDKKAGQYLAQGRVVALEVSKDKAKFQVAGSRSTPYDVRYLGEWKCDCEARVIECSHIKACQMITKFSAGRKISFGDDEDYSALLHAAFN